MPFSPSGPLLKVCAICLICVLAVAVCYKCAGADFRSVEDTETYFEHADRSNPEAELTNKPIAKTRAKIGTSGLSDATKSWISGLSPDDGTVAAAPRRPTASKKAPMPTDMCARMIAMNYAHC